MVFFNQISLILNYNKFLFSSSECPIGNSTQPAKDTNGYVAQNYPKTQLSPTSRPRHVFNNETTRRHSGIPHQLDSTERRNPLMGATALPSNITERRHSPHAPDNRPHNDHRLSSPPLRLNICDSGNLSPLSQAGNPNRLELSPRRGGLDLLVNPLNSQLNHSPPYYRNSPQDDSVKSESPSRKRRRLSRTGHHQMVEQSTQVNSWEHNMHRKSPRQMNHHNPHSHPHSHAHVHPHAHTHPHAHGHPLQPVVATPNTVIPSPPPVVVRRPRRFREPTQVRTYFVNERAPAPHQDFNHHVNNYTVNQQLPPEPGHHHHQSAMMVDINQVPVTISHHEPPTIWTICSAPTPAPPVTTHIHTCNMWCRITPQGCTLLPAVPQFGNCIGFQPHSSISIPQHYSHTHQHLPPPVRQDVLQRPSETMHDTDQFMDRHTHHQQATALHHAGATSLHVSPLHSSTHLTAQVTSAPTAVFLPDLRNPNTASMRVRARRMAAEAARRNHSQPRTRWHHATPLPIPAHHHAAGLSSYPGFVLQFL